MRCPSCKCEQPDANTTCESCGLIFAKYHPLDGPLPPHNPLFNRSLETPENGWTTHRIGKFTWKSGPTNFNGATLDPKSAFTKLFGMTALYGFLGFVPAFLSLAAHQSGRFCFYFFYIQTLGILIGLLVILRTFENLKKKRLMEDLPLSTVRGMAPGLVEITGAVSAAAPLLSPLTQKNCVYYEYTVEKFTNQGQNNSWMKVLNYDSQNVPFYLEDGTGKVMIKPAGSDLRAENPYQVEVNQGKNMPGPIADFVKSHMVADLVMTGRFRFTEKYIEVGKKIFVLGHYQKKDEEEAYVGAGPSLSSEFLISDMSRNQVESRIGRSLFGYFLFGLALIAVSLYFLIRGFLY